MKRIVEVLGSFSIEHVAFAFLLDGVDILIVFSVFDAAEVTDLDFFIVLDELDHVVHDSFELFVLPLHTADFLLDKSLVLLDFTQGALMRVINRLPELLKRVLIPGKRIGRRHYAKPHILDSRLLVLRIYLLQRTVHDIEQILVLVELPV